MGSSAPTASGAGHIPGWKWLVVWLLFLATLINYMDRQTVSAVSKHLKAEFHLTEANYGQIEFAFGFTFATFQFVAGWLADRYSIRWLYAIALVVWSLAGALTGLATTVQLLVACRVLLAIGEAFNWPCAVATVQRIMPSEQRSLANGIFHGGSSIGAILTPLLVLAVVGEHGEHWRWVFVIVGGGGVVWAVIWLMFVRGERADEIDTIPAPTGEKLPFIALLGRPAIWIAIGVGVSVNICWHFYRTWLPRYLDIDLHFTQTSVQWITAGFFVCADLGSMCTGLVTRTLARRVPVEQARKMVSFGTAGLCLLTVVAVRVSDPWLSLPLFFLVAAGAMGGFPNYFALTQEVSPRHTAQVLGLTGAASWYSVAAMAWFTGEQRDASGTFVPLFTAIGCVPLLGACLGLLWRKAKDEPVVATGL